MINLPQQWLEMVLEILRRRVPQAEVWVFGSRATEKIKPHSDLDLAIIAADRIPTADMDNLVEDFKESDLPIRVDVLDLRTVDPDFREIIMDRHEVLVRGSEQILLPN